MTFGAQQHGVLRHLGAVVTGVFAAIFVFAAVAKALDSADTARAIAALVDVVGVQAPAQPLVAALVVFEFGLGVLLLCRLWPVVTLATASGLLVLFVAASAVLLVTNPEAGCGCGFGGGDEAGPMQVVRPSVLAAAAIIATIAEARSALTRK